MSDQNLNEMNEWIHSVTGKESHWRSLEDLADSEGDKDALKNAIMARFPQHFLSRRDFMGWMGGLSAVLGLSACTRQPQEKILPYTQQPEGMIPGKALHFATAMPFSGGAQGLLVESHTGRPTKVDGNPDHPANEGSSDYFAQAAILDLYDPDRLRSFQFRGAMSSWGSFKLALTKALSESGDGVRVLTPEVISPTLGSQLRSLLSKYPGAKWASSEVVGRIAEKEGLKKAFGKDVVTNYNFKDADVIVSFESDFLGTSPGSIKYTKEFAARRSAESGRENFNRLYAIESTPTLTGSNADHRLLLRPNELYPFALLVAKKLGANVPTSRGLKAKYEKMAGVLAEELLANKGKCLITTGEYQDSDLHTLVAQLNTLLGNNGKTVRYQKAVEEAPTGGHQSLASLVYEMESGAVKTLLILGGNPAYEADADTNFTEALKKVPFSVHWTLHANETSKNCSWNVPATHFLENWSDARAYEGTASIVQPLIAPLYSGKSAHEVISAALGKSEKGSAAIKAHWKLSEVAWRKAIHDGVIAKTAFSFESVSSTGYRVTEPAAPNADQFDILLRPDPTVWDGQFSNNGWLQELPKPLTKVTWENVAYLSPKTAEVLEITNGQNVRLALGELSIEIPAWILPGQAENTALVHLGYGRKEAGRLGSGMGVNAYPLRSGATPWNLAGATLTKISGKSRIACTQLHSRFEERNLIHKDSVDGYKASPNQWKSHHPNHKESTVNMTERPYGDPDYAWGMAIDLSACTGCNSCVIACQSENNIPVVGKEEVFNEREMAWIRIDRYYQGSKENPQVDYQPINCMHCEKAPCEVVCPVGATQHSPEGLNEMAYNRCVGTKYCSNNCPYKVRRFNFYQYADVKTPSLKLGWNPNVTVRSRGVMEKCTYCVQRISESRITAKKEKRKIKDGEIKTACQSACPANAITFGNLKDSNSQVSKWKADNSNYSLLEGLGTLPRTTYLARLKNPNPKMATELEKADA